MRATIETTRTLSTHRQLRPAGFNGDAVERQHVSFWCVNKHQTTLAFAVDAKVNPNQMCRTCGKPAGPDRGKPPVELPFTPTRSHWDYVCERRSPEQRVLLLEEAVVELQEKRVAGLVI